MTQRIFILFMGLPRVMLAGLLVLAIGGGLALLYHARQGYLSHVE